MWEKPHGYWENHRPLYPSICLSVLFLDHPGSLNVQVLPEVKDEITKIPASNQYQPDIIISLILSLDGFRRAEFSYVGSGEITADN